MNDDHMNKLRSYIASETTLKTGKILFVTNTKFIAKIDDFSLNIAAIRVKDTQQSSSATGRTDARDVSRDELADSLMPGIGALYVLAEDTHNEALKVTASVPDSDPRLNWKIEEVTNQTAFFIGLLETNITALADHGYTQSDLDDLKSKNDAYSISQGATYQGMALQKAATATLSELFDEADEQLKALDRYVTIETKRHPDFAQEYWATRVIKDIGVRHEPEEAQPAPQPVQ